MLSKGIRRNVPLIRHANYPRAARRAKSSATMATFIASVVEDLLPYIGFHSFLLLPIIAYSEQNTKTLSCLSFMARRPMRTNMEARRSENPFRTIFQKMSESGVREFYACTHRQCGLIGPRIPDAVSTQQLVQTLEVPTGLQKRDTNQQGRKRTGGVPRPRAFGFSVGFRGHKVTDIRSIVGGDDEIDAVSLVVRTER